MSLQDQLKQLNDNPSDDVANWAADAYDYQQKFQAGELSAEEYNELVDDLKDSSAISAAASDLQAQELMYQVIEGLIALSSVA
jgi:polyhydroxyalkanoate synthesis regulator phasin